MTNNEQLQKRVNELEAKEAASEHLRGAKLHELTRNRLIQEAATDAPLNSDGSINKTALKRKLDESLKEETEYLNTVIKGSSYHPSSQRTSSATPEAELSEAQMTEQLKKSFVRQGYSEAQAKVMAEYQPGYLGVERMFRHRN